MGVGIAFFRDDTYTPFREEAITLMDKGSSNEAEYYAIIHALQIICNIYDLPEIHKITINTDSQLVFNQITREWQTRNPKLQMLLENVWILVKEIKKPLILFNWVPRTNERQQIADKLSKQANPYYNERVKS
jgi:ribonuclease HI